jgi:hypothetical protein
MRNGTQLMELRDANEILQKKVSKISISAVNATAGCVSLVATTRQQLRQNCLFGRAGGGGPTI